MKTLARSSGSKIDQVGDGPATHLGDSLTLKAPALRAGDEGGNPSFPANGDRSVPAVHPTL